MGSSASPQNGADRRLGLFLLLCGTCVWFERFALWELLGSDNARFDGGDGSRRGLVVIGLVVVLGR